MADDTIARIDGLPNFLEYPANKLLEEYGSGRHIPGSGSAAVLSALIAIEMMRTVCKLTIQKPNYEDVHSELRYILDQIEKVYKPQLRDFFQKDIEVFNNVSISRIARDKATSTRERRRLGGVALKYQRQATDIPIEVCRISLNLLPHAIFIFDNGFRSARGDSGVAISNLLSAISGGLFIVYLNLKSYRPSQWFWRKHREAEELSHRFAESQRDAFEKVLQLRDEALVDSDRQLKLDFV